MFFAVSKDMVLVTDSMIDKMLNISYLIVKHDLDHLDHMPHFHSSLNLNTIVVLHYNWLESFLVLYISM